MTDHTLSIDLHLHSTASDGTLSPTELVNLASENGVQVMSLTDHDTTEGLAEAAIAAEKQGIQFINGVELSVVWEGKVLHLLGLNIDPQHPSIVAGMVNLRRQRDDRAERIAKKLAAVGLEAPMEGAKKHAGTGAIARPHFARYMVDIGFVKDFNEAFDRYLGRNKRAYVSTEWPELFDAINWIKEAGGVAVIAHPLRYKFTASWMRRLLKAFKSAGGDGMEIICGNYSPDEISTSIGYALRFGLQGSIGSDFHGHSNYSKQPGHLGKLHTAITPVWSQFILTV